MDYFEHEFIKTISSSVRAIVQLLWVASAASLTILTAQAQEETADRHDAASVIQTLEVGSTKERLFTDGSYQTSVGGGEFGRRRQATKLLQLRRVPAFDPLNSGADLSMSNGLSALQSRASGHAMDPYVIQFHTQALPDYQRMLRELGAVVATAVPPNAVIALMSAETEQAIRSLSFVRATTAYLPLFKLQEGLENTIRTASDQSQLYSIMSLDKAHRAELVNFTESIGGVVLKQDPKQRMATDLSTSKTDGSRFSARLNARQLLQVSLRPETLFIDLRGVESEDLDQVRTRERFDYVQSVGGYCGNGVGLEVYDRGYRLTHTELINQPILVRSPAASTSEGGLNHGTEVAGIVFAEGINMVNGLLSCASRPIVFSRFSGFDNNRPTESQLRAHLAELVDPAGAYRAVVQTSSTDYTQTTQYTTWSAEYDEVMFDLDMVKTQSQSNEGNRNSRPAAWAKNVTSVGGFATNGTLERGDDSWGSASIGPAADDRIKPELSGQYGGIRTSGDGSNTQYTNFGGTSGATPTVGGAFGILFEMWADGVFDGGPGQNRDVFEVRPHAATARALMIHSAYRYDFSGGDSANMSRVHQGWGSPDLQNLYDTAQANGWQMPILVDEEDRVTPNGSNQYTLFVDGSEALKATMVYRDLRGNPAASLHRINDLSLRLTSPAGVVYWGNNGLRDGNWSTPGGMSNTRDTVENVFIQSPEVGQWTIDVLGDDIVQDSNPATQAVDAVYALVASGGVAQPPANTAPIVDAGAGGTIEQQETFSLTGSVIDDGFPGNPVSLTWSQQSGPDGGAVFATPISAVTTVTFSSPGNYVLQLTAADGEFSSFDTVTVVVEEPGANNPPVVTAGVDQSIDLPLNFVSVSGAVSDDAFPGFPLQTTWTGPVGVSFDNPNSLSAIAMLPPGAGSYTLTLTATDSQFTDSDSLVVTVINNPPVANDDTASTPINVAVLINVMANDSDPNAQSLTLVSATQSANGATQVDVSSGSVLYTPNSNFVGSDSFTYQIRDSLGATASATVTISVGASDVEVGDVSSTAGDQSVFTMDHLVVGEDRLLVVTVHCDGGGEVASISYGAAALTKIIDRAHPSDKPYVAAYQLLAPPTGLAQLRTELSEGNSDKCLVAAVSLAGVDQANPIDQAIESVGSTSIASVTVPSSKHDLVLEVMATGASDTIAPLSQQIVLVSREMGGDGASDHFASLSVATSESDGDVQLQHQLSESKEWVSIGLNIKAGGTVDVDVDTDSDGVSDVTDNCLTVANAHQRDTNNDGYGNSCDPDLNNDGVVNFSDVAIWVPFFNTTNTSDEDFNGDGLANFADFALFSSYFLRPPGPSGVATQ